MKAAKIEKGSSVPNRDKVAVITRAQAMEIAKAKLQDLNVNDDEAAYKTVAGTARSMGIDIRE